jgi:c-di-GMP-binding flagellar brake protein YcgR
MTNMEKRKHTRVESLNLSYISIDDAGNVINQGMGRTLNVSKTGILLESNFCALPDQTISLTLAIEEDLLDVKGKVVRCKELDEDLYHMGVEFVDLDAAARQTLSKFIAVFNDVQKTGNL